MGRLSKLAKLELPRWELDLAVAYLRGEVRSKEVALTAGIRAANVPGWVLPRLRMAWEEGTLNADKE